MIGNKPWFSNVSYGNTQAVKQPVFYLGFADIKLGFTLYSALILEFALDCCLTVWSEIVHYLVVTK